MRLWSAFAAAAIALMPAGCATMTRGTSEQLQINSDPPNAMATTSTGQSCRTPCAIEVPRKEEFSVVIAKAGYQNQMIEVKTQVGGAGGAGLAGSAVLGGLAGIAIDAAAGGAMEHVPNPIGVQLIPLSRRSPKSRKPGDKANDT
jgi:hypothetical protein